jgi:hypothetical protein
MEIFADREGIEHVSRHLMDAPELGSKFNGRIKNAEVFLRELAGYLKPKVQGKELDWIRNEATGVELSVLFLYADRELKAVFGIPKSEPLGYCGIVEITDELRPKVYRKPRGLKNDDVLEVNVVEEVVPIPTDEYRAYFKKYPGERKVFIANAFPGPQADEPLLPNRRIQTENEFRKSEEWWSKRAFVRW